MTTKNFNVKNGLTTGNIVLDAASGNITATNANLGNLVFANYHSGSGNMLSNIQGANVSGQVGNALVAGTVYTNAQPNITSVGTLGNLTVTSNVSAGNVKTDNLLYANGTAWSFMTVSGSNTQVQYNNNGAFGASSDFTFNSSTKALAVTGNITGGNLSGTTITGSLATASQPNITTVGTLTDLTVGGNAVIGGNLIVSGTTEFVNVTTIAVKDPIVEQGGGANNASLTTNDSKDRGTLLHYYTTTTVDAFMGWDNSNAEFAFGSNVSVSGEVVTFNSFGNVRVGNIIGNGQALTGINGSNVTGQVANALVAGTVYTNAQPNITSVGTLSSLVVGNASANVTITTANGNGFLTSTGNITAPYFIGNVVGNISGTLTVPGNNTAVLFNQSGAAGASDALKFNYSSNVLTVSGNLVASNANLGNLVTANYFSGAGNLLSNIQGANVSGTVANATYATSAGSATTAGTVTTAAQPNITSVGTLTSLTVSGNVTAGNITTSGSGGNITGANVVSANSFVGTTVSTNGLTSNRSNVSVTTNTVIDQFAPASFRTAKYLVSASGDNGYQSVEALIVHDGTTSYITIYGSLCSNNSADIIDLTSDLNGVSGNITLYATASGTNTKVNLLATYVKI